MGQKADYLSSKNYYIYSYQFNATLNSTVITGKSYTNETRLIGINFDINKVIDYHKLHLHTYMDLED